MTYIQLFSIHGLVRSENLELGRDADTGGQVTYVLELARALAQCDGVDRVDLVTRRLADKRVSSDYAVEEERITENCRIVRIQCGGRKYIRKELLWPHLDEFVDKTVKYLKRQGRIPDWFHGHYADAGYVAMHLAELFDVPFIFTGHSLGRAKLQRLLAEGLRESDIIKRYKIDHRIGVEEQILERADLIVASTQQEVAEQYGMYRGKDEPTYRVVAPGIDADKFYSYSRHFHQPNDTDEAALHHRAFVIQEMQRFFSSFDRPLILTLCRPDKRKNIQGLIHAYGEDKDLQAMANLAIFAGIRKDISSMNDNERDVLTQMLLLMDKYDLYGKMAVPKRHDFDTEVPELYRLTASKRGVFVNCALIEPFGLTVIESSACGLPVVATQEGGPRDILKNTKSGILIDPTKPKEIAAAIKTIIRDSEVWRRYSKAGIVNVGKFYTWTAHAKRYLDRVLRLAPEDRNAAGKTAHVHKKRTAHPAKTTSMGRRMAQLNHLLASDIDNTLLGGPKSDLDHLIEWLGEHQERVGFAVATGRTVESAAASLKEHGVPEPDVVISSVGTGIHYGQELAPDRGWLAHISHKWDRERVREVMAQFAEVTPQAPECQGIHKVSYHMPPIKDLLARIHAALTEAQCSYHAVYSHDQFLDILPQRASKGKALRYLSYKWEIPLSHCLVCGDSGNDEEMLRGQSLGVVVGNHSHELEGLKGLKRIFFASASHAGGILEGIAHYGYPAESTSGGSSK